MTLFSDSFYIFLSSVLRQKHVYVVCANPSIAIISVCPVAASANTRAKSFASDLPKQKKYSHCYKEQYVVIITLTLI